jgi:hypothetical protein
VYIHVCVFSTVCVCVHQLISRIPSRCTVYAIPHTVSHGTARTRAGLLLVPRRCFKAMLVYQAIYRFSEHTSKPAGASGRFRALQGARHLFATDVNISARGGAPHHHHPHPAVWSAHHTLHLRPYVCAALLRVNATGSTNGQLGQDQHSVRMMEGGGGCARPQWPPSSAESTPGGPGPGLRPGRRRCVCQLPLWFYITPSPPKGPKKNHEIFFIAFELSAVFCSPCCKLLVSIF